jgi:hypothetical protein
VAKHVTVSYKKNKQKTLRPCLVPSFGFLAKMGINFDGPGQETLNIRRGPEYPPRDEILKELPSRA